MSHHFDENVRRAPEPAATCSADGCGARVSWRKAYCLKHWRRIPVAERDAALAAARLARKGGQR